MMMPPFIEKFQFIDLTHELHEKIPTWSGGCGFCLSVKLDYPQGLRVQSLKSHAGVGTHIDAPSHFIDGSWNIGQIPLENLIVPAFVIDLRGKMNQDLLILPEDIEAFEKRQGKIQPRSLVLAHTGWDQFWNEPTRYRNVDDEGRMHFPGFSEEAAKLLLQREIVGLGIDTLSPDGSNNGPGAKFPVHTHLLGAKKYIIENVANLSALPAKGSYVIALPPRSKEATESTARIIGLIPK